MLPEAIDSILDQQVDFPIELIVHDDASTDKTPEIVKNYHEKYPQVFRPVLQEHNQLGAGINFVRELFNMAKGKYIAICDGDDYWTDPAKLADQVRQLQEHPEFSASFHRSDDLLESESKHTVGFWGPPHEATQFDLADLLKHGNFVPTSSIVMRSQYVREMPGTAKEVPHGDYTFLLMLAKHGPIAFIDRSMAVYRRHGGGQHTSAHGALMTQRALLTLVNAGSFLDLYDRPEWVEGTRERLSQLEKYLEYDKAELAQLRDELAHVTRNYARARQSKLFRLGVAIQQMLNRIRKPAS